MIDTDSIYKMALTKWGPKAQRLAERLGWDTEDVD